MSQCTNCPYLQAQIVRLQLQVSILERIIAEAQAECAALVTEAGEPMPKGVAPVFWAGEKVKRTTKAEAARRVMEKLSL